MLKMKKWLCFGMCLLLMMMNTMNVAAYTSTASFYGGSGAVGCNYYASSGSCSANNNNHTANVTLFSYDTETHCVDSRSASYTSSAARSYSNGGSFIIVKAVASCSVSETGGGCSITARP